MKAFTISEYAQATGIYRQLARLKLEAMLSKGSIRLSTPKMVRGKEVVTYEFSDGSEIDLRPSKPMIQVMTDYRFFSDPFNRTGWRT